MFTNAQLIGQCSTGSKTSQNNHQDPRAQGNAEPRTFMTPPTGCCWFHKLQFPRLLTHFTIDDDVCLKGV